MIAGIAPAPIQLMQLAKNQTFDAKPEILFPSKNRTIVILKYGKSQYDGDTNAASKDIGSCKVRIFVFDGQSLVLNSIYPWQQTPDDTENALHTYYPAGDDTFNHLIAHHYDVATNDDALNALIAANHLDVKYAGPPQRDFFLHRHARNLKKDKQNRMVTVIADLTPLGSPTPSYVNGLPLYLTSDGVYTNDLVKSLRSQDIDVPLRYLTMKVDQEGSTQVVRIVEDKTRLASKFKIKNAGHAALAPEKFKVLTIAATFFEK